MRRGDRLDDVFPPDHIREYAERSLTNLGTSSVDLPQFHVWEDAWASDGRWQRAVDSCIAGIAPAPLMLDGVSDVHHTAPSDKTES